MDQFEGRLTQTERRIVKFLRKHPFAVGTVIFVIAVLALWLLPKWEVRGLTSLTTPARFQAEDSLRVTIAQIIGGLLLLTGLYFTWWRIEESEESRRVAYEGQITERFTRAIEQLGSDKLELRLGAIYALERIARDSERDHWPVMEVLTAFVRERRHSTILAEPAADIQAVLTVLGRRARTYEHGEDKQLNLKQAKLQHADLRGAHLEGAFLYEANLEGAILYDAHLNEADLNGANLSGAKLGRANLRGASLWRADFKGAELTMADVTGANFGGALGEDAKNLKPNQISSTKGFKDPSTKLSSELRDYLINTQGEGTLGTPADALRNLKSDT